MATLTSVITGGPQAHGVRAGCLPFSLNSRPEDHSVSLISYSSNAWVRSRPRALEMATVRSVTTRGPRNLVVRAKGNGAEGTEGHMAAFSTADICDENEELMQNGDLRILYPVFKIYGRSEAFFGPTVTIKVFEENFLAVELLHTGGDGRVLVIDGGGSMRRAMIGGQLAHLAKNMGWSGILVNGCIRDVNEINDCDIGVRALASSPWRPGKKLSGETHLPVHIGGTIIHDGEWLYADNDGILISKTKLSITPYKTKVN